jgi:transposase
MLNFSSKDCVFLCSGPVDFRKQINGLISLTRSIIKENPYSHNYFVFINRKKTAIKVLHFDGQGYWMHLKRLSKGKFKWPNGDQSSIKLTPMELQVLMMNGDYQEASFESSWQAAS